MFELVYNRSIINALINTCYCGYSKLEPEANFTSIQKTANILFWHTVSGSYTPIIYGHQKHLLFFLTFDKIKNSWIFYHNNKNMSDNTNTMDLLKENQFIVKLNENVCGYIGIFTQGRAQIISEIDDGIAYVNPFFMPNVDFTKNTVHTIDDIVVLENYNDIIVPCQLGLVHLNPPSFVDLIFITMRYSSSKAHTSEIVTVFLSEDYIDIFKPILKNLKYCFQQLKFSDPKDTYGQIYQLFNQNDKTYFNNKMRTFQSDVINLFNQANNIVTDDEIIRFISEFINRIKIDLAIELSTVYRWLCKHPHERKLLYRKFSDNAYIKLLKMIHLNYLQSKKPQNFTEICRFIQAGEDTNAFDFRFPTHLLIDAIETRSELFCFMYEKYLFSKQSKPLYKKTRDNNYYPFKIFSASLFVMAHL